MITIFTPTYNRGKLLLRLYKSLQNQTDYDFEWIIVDDGSTDKTHDICKQFINEELFHVTYVFQKNAGKHIAINRAASLARGRWFFIVDSDDYLPPNSIALNKYYLDQIQDDDSFAGVSGLLVDPQGKLLLFPGMKNINSVAHQNLKREYIDATPQNYRDRYKMPGDRAEVIRTDIVRDYPFPSFPGENFVSEYYLWQSISDRGLKLRWFNRPTYVAQYREKGLSRTMPLVMRSNPLGRSFIDNFTLRSKASFKMKICSAINYTRYGRLAGKSVRDLARSASRKSLFVLGLIPALLLPIKDVKK